MLGLIKMALKAFLWPIIKDLIKKYGRELIEWLFDKLKTRVGKQSGDNVAVATNKAVSHEKAARMATNQNEADKHKAVAQVWREAADMFRQENERLNQELQQLRARAESENNQHIDGLSLADAFSEKEGRLAVVKNLPKLPK